MSSFETILLERTDAIATLTINRPDRANVLSQATMQELSQALDEVASDDIVRSVIITGAGDRVFVGGADIRELRDTLGGLSPSFYPQATQAYRANPADGKTHRGCSQWSLLRSRAGTGGGMRSCDRCGYGDLRDAGD